MRGRRKRLPRFAALLLTLCVLALVLFGLAQLAPEKRILPLPAPGKAADPTEGLRRDIAWVRTLPRVDGSFDPARRAAFDKALDDLSAKAGQLDPTAFDLGLSRAVALGRNGHTNLMGTAWGRGVSALPIRLLWFSDGLYVVKADPKLKDLLGARVVSVAGRDPETVTAALRAYLGGTAIFARQFAPYLIEQPAALHTAGLAPSPAETEFVFQLADGTRLARPLAARPGPIVAGKAERRPQRDLSPVPVEGETGAWVHVLGGGAPVPLWLARRDRSYWHVRLPQGPLYVQINRTRSDPDQPLNRYLDTVLEEVRRTHPPAAIVDLRFNTGGNMFLTDRFTRDLPRLLPGGAPILVLTGPNTFSAAMVVTAQLKARGGARIVGERVGDDEQFWAEGEGVTLPNSGLELRYSNAWHDWEHGCGLGDLGRCYWPNYLMGVAAGSLSPDVVVPLSFADWRAGRDRVLERALQMSHR